MANDTTSATGKSIPLWIIRSMTTIHKTLRSITGHRFLNTIGGDEVCFVAMRGAKSGRDLNVPLMYVPYKEGVLLVASQGGNPNNPKWYHNLVKHPDVTVEHRGRFMELRARLATSEEKDELWPICDEHYAPFAEYRTATERDIPIFVCEPR